MKWFPESTVTTQTHTHTHAHTPKIIMIKGKRRISGVEKPKTEESLFLEYV